MLQNNEEVLQRHMIRVEHTAMFLRGFNELLHYELGYVHQVAALNNHGVPS